MSDLISREETIARFVGAMRSREKSEHPVPLTEERFVRFLKAMPPATEPREGRWIIKDEIKTLNESYTCDQCGYIQWFPKVRFFNDSKRVLNYCPNCGAKMERSE